MNRPNARKLSANGKVITNPNYRSELTEVLLLLIKQVTS